MLVLQMLILMINSLAAHCSVSIISSLTISNSVSALHSDPVFVERENSPHDALLMSWVNK